MRPSLDTADMAAINALSRTEIELTTAGLKPFLERSIWIGKTNHYVKDAVIRLRKNPSNTKQKRNLAQYIMASVSLHTNDGWSYLGRAVACLLAGDMHRALHLAYYAELRAAMSLLASAGIGIFSNRHFVISAANSTTKLRSAKGTHVLAWMALEHWCTQPVSGALFANIVRPEGRTLDEWFQPYGGATALAPQAKSWFMQWGMDLGLASKDREARNESSYSPDGVPTTWNAPPNTVLEFVRDMWAVLEPSSTSSFEQIDRHILRIALEQYYHGSTGKKPSAKDPGYVARVDSTLSAQSLSSSTEERLKKFLLRQIAPADPVIFPYSATRPDKSPTDVLAVLSRAVLLLRIATGSAYDLLQNVGFDSNLLSFWWQKVGEARGLWQPGTPPTALSDLWADVEETLNELTSIQQQDPAALQSTHHVTYGMAGLFNIFSSHERVGLWGLCPT